MKKSILFYIFGVIIIFLLWIPLNLIFKDSIVPSPWNTFSNIFRLIIKGDVFFHLSLTLLRTLAGFVIAFTAGSVIGIISGLYRNVEKTLFVPVVLLQGAPPLLWIIPLMLVLGTDGLSPVAVVFFVVMPLVVINVQEGVKAITKSKWDMMKIYADSGILKVKELILPSIKSHFNSIFVLGIVLALKSCLVGEWFGAKNGIGRVINEYFYTFNMLSFYSVALIFLISVSILTFILKKTADYVLKRKQTVAAESVVFKKTDFDSINGTLKLISVDFSYNKKMPLLLNDVNLDLKNTIVLTGESGIGKTTLAKLACGLIKPVKGKIEIPEKPGIIFQEDAFLEHRDCVGNVMLPFKWKKEAEAVRKAVNILEMCGLKDYKNYFPDELSGGMKKRLSLARAVALNPSFIIIDEPFAQLHKDARTELWDLFFKLFPEKGVPSLIITHFPEELKNRNVQYQKLYNGKLIKYRD